MRQIICKLCMNAGTFQIVKKDQLKKHIWKVHYNRDIVAEKLEMKMMDVREGIEYEEYSEERRQQWLNSKAAGGDAEMTQ